MPIPTAITDLSTTATSNSPSGNENPIEGDNHLRTAYAFIRQNYDSIQGKVSTADLASTSDATKNAGQVGASPTLNYAVQTIGAAVFDGMVNVMWFITDANHRADVKARTLTYDLTTELQTAHTWANGRPVFYPKGAYKFSSLSLTKVGDGIVGDSSGGMLGEDSTLLVSTVTGTTAAIQLTASTAHNVILKDFTLKQNGSVQGRGVVADDCYWLRTDNLRVKGFTDNLYMSRALYHHHKRLLSESSTNGVNYWGSSGTWNSAWYNNVITFDTCRFSQCTAFGATIKGTEVVFINPDFSGMTTGGAIGLKVYGESASYRAHGIKIISPYVELTQIVFSFQYAKVEIDGGGYIQGGPNVGGQYMSIIDADASTVLWSGIEDKDYFANGYRLTNGSTLTMRQNFSGSIRATAGTVDATSSFLVDDYEEGTYTGTLTGCTTSPTGTISYVRKGKMVTLILPSLTATSNSTACTITGAPAALRPTATRWGYGHVIDNGSNFNGAAGMSSAGALVLSKTDPGAAATSFANAGGKGTGGFAFTYALY